MRRKIIMNGLTLLLVLSVLGTVSAFEYGDGTLEGSTGIDEEPVTIGEAIDDNILEDVGVNGLRETSEGLPGMGKINPETIKEAMNHNMLDHTESINVNGISILSILNQTVHFPVREPLKENPARKRPS